MLDLRLQAVSGCCDTDQILKSAERLSASCKPLQIRHLLVLGFSCPAGGLAALGRFIGRLDEFKRLEKLEKLDKLARRAKVG